MNTGKDFFSGFMAKVEKSFGCWKWKGAKRGGSKNQYGNYRGRLAHRVSYELFFCTKIPDGKIVLHICDNPICVNPQHLKVGTLSENAVDMYNKGRSPNSKMHPAIADEIRSLVRSGIRQSNVAEKFGISRASVCNIVNGDRWAR